MSTLLIWLMACATNVDKSTFAESYASAYCRALKKCSRGQFESLYELMSDCELDVTESMIDFMTISEDVEGCSYDNTSAQTCLQRMNEASCVEHWEEQLELQQACYEDTWVCED